MLWIWILGCYIGLQIVNIPCMYFLDKWDRGTVLAQNDFKFHVFISLGFAPAVPIVCLVMFFHVVHKKC